MDNMGSAGNFSVESEPHPVVISSKSEKETRATVRKRIAASQAINILQQAQTLQQQARLHDATELYQQLLESDFDQPDVRYFLGWLYQEQRQWDDAIHQFQKLLHDPDYALSTYYALGLCYRESGDLRTAVVHFDGAIEQLNLDILTIAEADQLVKLCQEAAEAHYRLGEQEQALTIIRALNDFLQSRGWSEQIVQVKFMLEQLQNGLPPHFCVQPTPVSVSLQPQKHSSLQSMKQRVTRPLSAISPLRPLRVAWSPLRSNWLWRTIIILILITVSLGSIGIGSYVFYLHSHTSFSVAVRPSKTALHPSATVSSPTPSSTTSAVIAGSYHGTLHDFPTGLTTNISFTEIQQHQKSISGYFEGMPKNDGSVIPQNGPFKGTLDASKHLQLVVTNGVGQTSFSFDGQIRSDSNIVGTYCNLNGNTRKCSDYGFWSISP